MPLYKHGTQILKHPNREIDLTDFKRALQRSMMSPLYKAYAVLLYWLGCRRSEPLYLRREDIEESEGTLYIDITVNRETPHSRLKNGLAAGPIDLPLSLFGMEFVRAVWKATPEGAKIFRFSDKTGYRIIKRLFPNKSPHWLRHNRLTKLRKERDRGKLSIDDIKSFTGIRRDSTIEGYGMKTKPGIHKVTRVLEGS